MIQQFKEITSILPEQERWQQVNEGLPANYDRGLAICFDEKGRFISVEHCTGNRGVVYRSGPSNGTDHTPCCKLATTTDNRILKAIKALAEAEDIHSINQDQHIWLEATIREFETNRREIWQKVQQSIANSDIDGRIHRGYVFWAKKKGLHINPVYSWDACKEYLVQSSIAKWEKMGGVRSNGCCFICGEEDKKVAGNYSLLACYNLDKSGSIAGGFHKSSAHRNFPVCEGCMLDLSQALIFVQENLTSYMAGQSYMVLPFANTVEVRERLRDAIQDRPHLFRLSDQQDLVGEEMDILDEFQDAGDQLAFSLIFFKEEQASWRIQAEIQEVLPSRMHRLYSCRKSLEKDKDLWIASQGDQRAFVPTGRVFKYFSEVTARSEDIFRNWICSLFEGKSIDQRQFLRFLVLRILHVSRTSPQFLKNTVVQAWGLYRFAAMTELIHIPGNQGGGIMQEVIPNSAFGRYMVEHSDFFNRPEKVVAFLTGCYASIVTSVQYKKRGGSPFTKKFTGKLLNHDVLQRLYREGRDKLYAYDALGIVAKSLDPDLAQAWIACGDKWLISDEEATFVFFLGNSLAYRIGELYGKTDIQEFYISKEEEET